jgi:hypothetical protein
MKSKNDVVKIDKETFIKHLETYKKFFKHKKTPFPLELELAFTDDLLTRLTENNNKILSGVKDA